MSAAKWSETEPDWVRAKNARGLCVTRDCREPVAACLSSLPGKSVFCRTHQAAMVAEHQAAAGLWVRKPT